MLQVADLRILKLRPISFSVAEGECLAIEGPSGSGKSKLLRAIADLDQAKGEVFLNTTERNEMPGHLWRTSVRYVASEPGWWADTPRETFPPADTAQENERKRLLDDLSLDAKLLDREVCRLSTGERQRLAFIRALLDNPSVILMDEPTASLDVANSALVENLISDLKRARKILLLVSHDPAQIGRLADARLQLSQNGEIKKIASREVT